MSDAFMITIDGSDVSARPGQTILEAAEDAGIWIPRLCHLKGLLPQGGCRVCLVRANGRMATSCTQPVAPGMLVDNEDDEEVAEARRAIVEMLLVEGNHLCMFCEKSGRCELQAVAYRLGIDAASFEFQWPQRELDATHPDVIIDRNRCILCARCERTSRDHDGKRIFHFAGRGPERRVIPNSPDGLGETDAAVTDEAVAACPVGCLIPKRRGYDVPVGRRRFDPAPIGADVETVASGKED
jgi:[NiFe] hydrogenase diaphorase moiety small subunit